MSTSCEWRVLVKPNGTFHKCCVDENGNVFTQEPDNLELEEGSRIIFTLEEWVEMSPNAKPFSNEISTLFREDFTPCERCYPETVEEKDGVSQEDMAN